MFHIYKTRTGIGMLILGAGCLAVQCSWAQEEPALSEPEEGIEIAKPLVYSTSLMALGLPMLMVTGVYDNGPSLNRFEQAFTLPPRWDNDTYVFNYILHPLWGSETYLRAREARWGVPGSIGFSMGMSVTWEYLIESWVERPSIPDLIFTTGVGWAIGELRYRLKERTSEEMHWWVDPIHKTLEHLHIVAAPDKKGGLSAGLTVSIHF
jgi:hypothetical protein